ncbi:caspase family protein [Salinispira pacifica]|uniref:Peptidase C14 caspase domain-containing protein n=1 Tax=Salinispira pacifica TaxID=1307761 RepID=V5WCY3_9SPIO|nr:caspase family protein [Salinispira pacifica]AHC13678.1 hypothetical protein L21SP2_0236 [Salinispira pacifica]
MTVHTKKTGRYTTIRRAVLMGLIGLLWLTAVPAFGQESDSGSASGPIRRFGLFVGTNDGGSSRQELRWAVSDAIKLSRVLSEVGGILPGDGVVLENPGKRNVEQTFTRLSRIIDESSEDSRRVEFVFYYSGHSDETGLLLGDEHFAYQELRENINSVDADVSIAILDSCASGAFTRTKGGVRTQPFLLDDSSSMSGHAFITSSSADELAQESDRIEASFFTHYMVSALRGAADHSGDRKVTLNEAYEYAFNETLSVTSSSLSGPQHPSYNINLSGSGDLVLTDLSNPVSSVVLDEEIAGRVYVKNGRRNIVAEINKPADKILEIALDPGIYHLELSDSSGSAWNHSFNLSYRSQKFLVAGDFYPLEQEQNRSRGGSPSEPFMDEDTEIAQSSEGARAVPAPYDDVTNADGSTSPAPSASDESSGDNSGRPSGEDDFFAVEDDFFTTEEDFFSDKDDFFSETTPSTEAAQPEPDESGNRKEPETGLKTGSKTAGGIEKTPADETVSPRPVTLSYHPFYVSAVPGISYPVMEGRSVQSTFAYSPLILDLGGLAGLASAGIFTTLYENSSGVMSSGIGNVSRRNFTGVQSAGIFNTAEGSITGVQTAGVFNTSMERSSAAQVAGVFNVADEPLSGAQLAGVFNTADHQMNGVQAAGVFNSTGLMNGVQVAGVFNGSRRINGAQLSTVNITEDGAGAQIGVLNIARGEMKGIQLGVINISNDLYGIPIGLFSWVKKGIHDIGWWVENDTHHFLGIANGSRNFYTTLYGGILPVNGVDQLEDLTMGFGWGTRLKFRPLYADLEISIRRGSVGDNANQRLASIFDPENRYTYPSAKAVVGLQFLGMGFYMGVNADLELEPGLTGGYSQYNGPGGGSYEIPGFGTVHNRFTLGFRL